MKKIFLFFELKRDFLGVILFAALFGLGGCNGFVKKAAIPDLSQVGCFHDHSKSQNNSSNRKNLASIWVNLVENFGIRAYTGSERLVREQLDWYLKHPGAISYMGEKSRPYLYFILSEIKRLRMPAEIALLPMVESTYDPLASGGVASGLWQIMPGTASAYGLRINWWYDGRRDIVASTMAALTYLNYLATRFHNNWLLAIAAYNVGEGTVSRALRNQSGHPTFWQLPLPISAKKYIAKLLALAILVKNIDLYPTMHLPIIQDQSYFVEVKFRNQIDLRKLSFLLNMSLERLRNLNPGFNRWATEPNGRSKVLIPKNLSESLKKAIANSSANLLLEWRHYQVKKGDSIWNISRKYGTTVALIKKINNLTSDNIRVRQELLVPKGIFNSSFNDLRDVQLHHGTRLFPEVEPIIYTIRKGDNLTKIARKFDISIIELCFWNNLSDRENIYPGIKLTIWPKRPRGHITKMMNHKVGYHFIKSGETLIGIAHQYKMSLDDLISLNKLSSTNISIGQSLKVRRQ